MPPTIKQQKHTKKLTILSMVGSVVSLMTENSVSGDEIINTLDCFNVQSKVFIVSQNQSDYILLEEAYISLTIG